MTVQRWSVVVMGVMCGVATAQTPLVPLRWVAEPEKRAAYDLSVRLEVEQREGADEARRMALRQDARVSVWVESLGDDGSASLLGRVSDVRMHWKEGEHEGSSGEIGVEPSDPIGRTLAAIGAAADRSGLRLTIDARGAITGFSGLEGVADALAGQTSLDEGALGALEMGAMASRLAPVFQGDAAGVGEALAGAGARRVGSPWTTKERVDMGSAGALEITTEWTLQDVAEGVARIEGSSRVKALLPDPASPGAPVVRVEKGEGTTIALWSLALGALVSHETEQSLTMVWTLGDLELRQTQTSSSTLRRAEPE